MSQPRTLHNWLLVVLLLAATRAPGADPALLGQDMGIEAPRHFIEDWVVAPIPISNPTIGTGLAVVAMPFYHLGEGSPLSNTMLATGYTTRRGRRAALVHRDRINGRVRGRRGTRMLALTSGGAIPEVADYAVVLEPEEIRVGTVNEDFAIESMSGDIFQLGNRSWRVLKVLPGVLRVADAGTFHSSL